MAMHVGTCSPASLPPLEPRKGFATQHVLAHVLGCKPTSSFFGAPFKGGRSATGPLQAQEAVASEKYPLRYLAHAKTRKYQSGIFA
jgi:hypothetical protein